MKKILIFLLSLYTFVFADIEINTYYTGDCPSNFIVPVANVQNTNYFAANNKTYEHSYVIDPNDRTNFHNTFNITSIDQSSSSCSHYFIRDDNLVQRDVYNYSVTSLNCQNGDVPDANTSSCVTPAPPDCNAPNQHLDTNTNSCVCDAGYAAAAPGGTCCYVGNANTSYNVDQATCDSTNGIKIDNLTFLSNLSWNECLNTCIASAGECPPGKVFDSNGQCVPPYIDPTDCEAQGGTLQNYRTEHADTCIDNGGNSISPCCEYTADCVKNDSPISTYSVYVSCGADSNQTVDNNTTTDLNTTTDPGADNKCNTCPTQYPIANDQGSCENSQGDILMCPAVDYNNTTPIITCGTCNSLGAEYSAADNGQCVKTTSNNIKIYVDCPTANNNNNLDVNTSVDNNTTFNDSNASINNNSENGDGTKNICTCCPSGYKSISGQCVLSTASGEIQSIIPCPCPGTNVDGNGTGPANNNDGNGSNNDDNVSGMLDGFGNSIEGKIRSAYKGYSFFNTSDCGSLQLSQSAYLFNQPEAEIKDPLPMFVEILTPYRDIIKGFLMFIAIIIGLFDFFKRS